MLSPSEAVTATLRLAVERPPSLGAGRLICVDGPSGAGKTEFAARLAARTRCRVIHLDDLYDGWGGLGTVADSLHGLLSPLAAGRAGSYRRYDWDSGQYVETVAVPPTPLLIIEGVGAGVANWRDLHTVLVWVTAPEGLRHRRALTRDGAVHRPQLEQWWADEAAHFAADGTPQRADVIVDGAAATPSRGTPATP